MNISEPVAAGSTTATSLVPPADHQRRASSSGGRRRHRWWLIAALVVMVMLAGPAVSYTRALTAPGAADWSSRTVDWIRDHGGSGAINTIENWYYRLHPPSNEAPAVSVLPAHLPAASQKTTLGGAPGGPPRLRPGPPTRAMLSGENQWIAGRVDPTGRPLLYTSFIRPDRAHASVVVGVSWIRQPGVVAHLVAGTAQPGGTSWTGNAAVTPGDVANLVATFNSGWRMHDISGGFALGGRTASPLVTGQATAIIDDLGHLDVVPWRSDLTYTRHLVAARQNLDLVVDHARPVSGLTANSGGQWGSPKNQFQFTSRSGLGVDAHGNLVYVAGPGLSLSTLARALADSGAVRGMELDIHNGHVFFASWPGPAHGSASPTKLLPTMTQAANRYISPDQRDFFYLTVANRAPKQ